MITVTEYEGVTPAMVSAWRLATRAVAAIPGFGLERHRPQSAPACTWTPLRCHEVVRIVYAALTDQRFMPAVELARAGLGFAVVDGRFGSTQHSWLGLVQGTERAILDCYAVGQLPPVQLVHDVWRNAELYVADVCRAMRDDIRTADIDELLPEVLRGVYAADDPAEPANVCDCGHGRASHTIFHAYAASTTGCAARSCNCIHFRSKHGPL